MEKELFDCVIVAGELDKSGYRYIMNENYSNEVVKTVASTAEAQRWCESSEAHALRREKSKGGKLDVSIFFTLH